MQPRDVNAYRSARELRRAGRSVGEIARAVGVSKSTASLWVRDVELTAEQRAQLDERSLNPSKRALAWSASRRARRADAQERGRALARDGDSLFVSGCMLFWAEGSKNRNAVHFTNADVATHRLFLRFLVERCDVRPADVKLTINCFLGNGFSLAEIERWWVSQLQLPPTVLRRSVVNRLSRSSQGKRRTLPMGTARLTVHSTELAQTLYGAIQEIGGFERPEWLDMGTVPPAAAA